MGRKKKKYKTINLEGRDSELDRLSNCSVVAIDNYFRSLMVKK